MKDLKFSALLDLYGKMLTDKQQAMMRQYYHLDCSLGEVAESEGISRQAVHASLRGAQNTLLQAEQQLGFYEKVQNAEKELGVDLWDYLVR
ncbi:MAG: hypothetical protein FWH03_07185 [Firmicutes bacterium]|nr:hypothetical protein [Bacillota bacterium]